MKFKSKSNTTQPTDTGEAVEYVPDFRGNREEPPEEQGYVLIMPMTARELKKAEAAIRMKFNGRDDAITVYERKTWALKEQVIKDRCVGVVNIWAETTPIKNGSELWEFCMDNDAALIDLLEDIFEAIKSRSKLEDGLRKNSNSPRGLLSVATGG